MEGEPNFIGRRRQLNAANRSAPTFPANSQTTAQIHAAPTLNFLPSADLAGPILARPQRTSRLRMTGLNAVAPQLGYEQRRAEIPGGDARTLRETTSTTFPSDQTSTLLNDGLGGLELR